MNARAVERDDWFDSAKLAILALVVFGHFLDHYSRSSWVASQIFVAIYLFHMPAIIFLAGYFTKGPARPDHFQRVLQRALLPYLIFQTLYSLQFTAQPFSALFLR